MTWVIRDDEDFIETGYYTPEGEWVHGAYWDTGIQAERHVNYLNGGTGAPQPDFEVEP